MQDLAEFVPPPFGNSVLEDFNPLYHIKIKEVKIEKEQKKGAKEEEADEDAPLEIQEDKIYQRKVPKNITKAWLDLKPSKEHFFRELQ